MTNDSVNILHSPFLSCFASWNVNIEKELTSGLNYNSISAKKIVFLQFGYEKDISNFLASYFKILKVKIVSKY